jgi:hypothetical protein
MQEGLDRIHRYDPASTDALLAPWHVERGKTSFATAALGCPSRRAVWICSRLDRATVTYARDGLIEQAWRILNNDLVVIPLYRPLVVWAMRDNLELPANPSVPLFREARLTGPR